MQIAGPLIEGGRLGGATNNVAGYNIVERGFVTDREKKLIYHQVNIISSNVHSTLLAIDVSNIIRI